MVHLHYIPGKSGWFFYMTIQHNMKREIKIFYQLFILFIYYIIYTCKFLWSKWEYMYFEDDKLKYVFTLHFKGKIKINIIFHLNRYLHCNMIPMEKIKWFTMYLNCIPRDRWLRDFFFFNSFQGKFEMIQDVSCTYGSNFTIFFNVKIQ